MSALDEPDRQKNQDGFTHEIAMPDFSRIMDSDLHSNTRKIVRVLLAEIQVLVLRDIEYQLEVSGRQRSTMHVSIIPV
jgi:hypothetical protein